MLLITTIQSWLKIVCRKTFKINLSHCTSIVPFGMGLFIPTSEVMIVCYIKCPKLILCMADAFEFTNIVLSVRIYLF